MPARLSRALPLLMACAPFWFAGHAAASQTISASACDAANPYTVISTRFWGVSNPHPTLGAVVSCAMPNDEWASSGYRIHGLAMAGASIPCTLRELEKLDGRVLAVYSFTITGSTPATVKQINHPSWVTTVAELTCTLPAKGRGQLYALESF